MYFSVLFRGLSFLEKRLAAYGSCSTCETGVLGEALAE